MAVHEDDYVIVNIWTSEKHAALPGANVGHASITLSTGEYISFWPGKSEEQEKARKSIESSTRLWVKKGQSINTIKDGLDDLFGVRPPKFRASYEEDCLMEAYAEGHCRPVTFNSKLEPNEVFARVNSQDYSWEKVDVLSQSAPDHYRYYIIKPLPATCRIVFYSLNEESIKQQFRTLQQRIQGWTLIGSDALARNFQNQTSENCASVVYQCLESGGLYKKLPPRFSFDTASSISPDKLLTHLVPAKEEELTNYPETVGWSIEGVNEYSLAAIKEAFKQAETTVYKSSTIGCTLL